MSRIGWYVASVTATKRTLPVWLKSALFVLPGWTKMFGFFMVASDVNAAWILADLVLAEQVRVDGDGAVQDRHRPEDGELRAVVRVNGSAASALIW